MHMIACLSAISHIMTRSKEPDKKKQNGWPFKPAEVKFCFLSPEFILSYLTCKCK